MMAYPTGPVVIPAVGLVASGERDRSGPVSHLRGEVYGLPLTAREYEVLAALAELDTCKAAAARLGLSFQTIKNHSVTICAKLGVVGRQAAFRHPSVGFLRVPAPDELERRVAIQRVLSTLERVRDEATALIAELRAPA